MRLTPAHHDTLAAAIGRREWARTRTDMERATLVLERMSGFAVDHVTPLQLAVAMGCMPLNAQDIANYADMACALAMALPKSVNAELLTLANQCASECAECDGTGLVTRSLGGDGFGDRCAALADADDQPCPDCADIRQIIRKTEEALTISTTQRRDAAVTKATGAQARELARLRKVEAAALRVASSRRNGIVKDQGPLDALDAALESQ